jgi:hypothetical protein
MQWNIFARVLLKCRTNYTNSIHQNLSWETYAVGQELARLLWNSKSHDCTFKTRGRSACEPVESSPRY